MFEVKRYEEKPIVIIRIATPYELSNYEKWKLENKIAKIEPDELALKAKLLQNIYHQKSCP